LEAKAVCVALAAFQESAPNADLKHYAIVIGREGRNYHIIFAPNPGPGEETLVGGETKYGAVRGYVIAPRTFKILRCTSLNDIQLGDAANGWKPWFLTFHETPPSTRSHAPARPLSLILVSLDGEATRVADKAPQAVRLYIRLSDDASGTAAERTAVRARREVASGARAASTA